MTMAWWATCSISACFYVYKEKLQTFTWHNWFIFFIFLMKNMHRRISYSTHLIYLKVNADDNKAISRLFAHQMWVFWQILLTVVPAPQHSWCTNKHIQHNITFRLSGRGCVFDTTTQICYAFKWLNSWWEDCCSVTNNCNGQDSDFGGLPTWRTISQDVSSAALTFCFLEVQH